MNGVSSKIIAGGFGTALLLLCGVGVAGYVSVQRLRVDKQLVIHSYEVLQTIDDVENKINCAELERRGYIISGEITYLNAYNQKKPQVYKALKSLRTLTRKNLNQQSRLKLLEPMITQRFILQEKSIELFEQNQQDELTQIRITNDGKKIRQEIQVIAIEIKNQEKALLQQRTLQTNKSFERFIFIFAFGFSLSLCLLVVVYLLLQNQISINKTLSQEAISLEKQAAKARLSSFLESTTDAFVALDCNWNYTYVNQRAGELFNRDAESLIGKNIWEEFPEGIGQKFYQAYHQAIAQQRIIKLEEYYPPWKRWFENRIYPSPEGLSIFFQDITERKQLEQELQLQIEFDRIVASISSDFINLSSLEITSSINKALEKIAKFTQVDTSYIFRYSDAEATASMTHEWMLAEIEPQIEKNQNIPDDLFPWASTKVRRREIVYFYKLIELPEVAAIDRDNWMKYQIKSLICIPMSYENNVLGFVGFATFRQEKTWSENSIRLLQIVSEIFTNALQRQQSEVILKAQEQRWELAIEGNNDGIWDHDLITNRHFLSPQCRKIIGYKSHEVVTFDEWCNLTHPEDQENLIKAFQAHLQGETQYYSCEYRMRCQDGSYKWLLARGKALSNDQGIPIRAIGSITDISDRKFAEAALQQLNQELEIRVEQRTVALQQLNQELIRSNEELEKFAYVASHDLQEPLRAVIGYTQLLETEYQQLFDDSAREYMGFITDGAMRMRQLIQDLLAYSRISTSKQVFLAVDCHEVLTTTLSNLQTAIAQSQATVTYSSLPTIIADKTQLVQLFQNLIGNAIKYNRNQPPKIQIGAARSGELEAVAKLNFNIFNLNTNNKIQNLQSDEIIFWVQDNGIGIKYQYLERIFEVFRRLHSRREYPGTGIGLAICKKIVERHGGCIWADSEPGVGTIFYFTVQSRLES